MHATGHHQDKQVNAIELVRHAVEQIRKGKREVYAIGHWSSCSQSLLQVCSTAVWTYSVNLGELTKAQLPDLLNRNELFPSLPNCEAYCWRGLIDGKQWICHGLEASLLVKVQWCLHENSCDISSTVASVCRVNIIAISQLEADIRS